MKLFGRLLLIIMVAQALPIAWAGQVQGQFSLQKGSYFVNEPVFVVLDLTNPGGQPIWVSQSCAWLDTRFEAPTAPRPHRRASLFGCMGEGTAGSCAGGVKEIGPGEHYTRRYLLDGFFRLDSAGSYPIRAWHKVDIYSNEAGAKITASQEIVSQLNVTLVRGSEQEVASAYEPILHDLKSPNSLLSSMALAALVQNPPLSLEGTVMALADNPQTAAGSVPGLEHLATPRAKSKLTVLSAANQPEYIHQMAITALGGLGDPAYCALMLDIAQESREYSRFIALRGAGYLCGERVLTLATRALGRADHPSRFEAAYALGNSHSPEAVPLLISLLSYSDPIVRGAACNALATLTHRRSPNDGGPAEAIHRDWENWWISHGAAATIYGIDNCKEPQPLP